MIAAPVQPELALFSLAMHASRLAPPAEGLVGGDVGGESGDSSGEGEGEAPPAPVWIFLRSSTSPVSGSSTTRLKQHPAPMASHASTKFDM